MNKKIKNKVNGKTLIVSRNIFEQIQKYQKQQKINKIIDEKNMKNAMHSDLCKWYAVLINDIIANQLKRKKFNTNIIWFIILAIAVFLTYYLREECTFLTWSSNLFK